MRRKSNKTTQQRRFIFRNSAGFTPVKKEDIYDSEHIFPQLQPIFDYLRNFRSYHRENIPVDGGAVLCGPPGMGKTLFARYIATESDARFVNVREFPVEIKNGVQLWQPKDVASLFSIGRNWVKKYGKPIVFFIDQFDNFLEANSADIKSQFELELDGFLGRGEGIFLLVTSQSMPKVMFIVTGDDDDELSPSFGGALFRRGRIGIHIPFSKPDFAQSEVLLRGFLEGHPHADHIDCGSLVRLLDRPTPADIKYAVSEARQLVMREAITMRASRKTIRTAPITQKQLIGIFLSKVLDKETGHAQTEAEKHETAVHELGHYIVGRALGLPTYFVSIRPGLSTVGITFGNDDLKTKSHEDLRRQIAFVAGGWEAERLYGISSNTGKSADLFHAADIAEKLIFLGERKYLKPYGHLQAGRIMEEGSGINMSQRMLVALEKDIARLLTEEELRARHTLRFFGKGLLKKIAKVLAKNSHGVMLQKELDALIGEKLSDFHKRHRIVDRMKKATVRR